MTNKPIKVDSEQDERLQLVNSISNTLIALYGEYAINHAEYWYNLLEANVRNVYELIDEQAPFFYLYRLMKYGAEDFGLTLEEHEEIVNRLKTKLGYGN